MSIKKNFVYSSILTVSNYLFPLLTFPYISRVLGVTNIGICNYVDSIITYFVFFSYGGCCGRCQGNSSGVRSRKETK